MCPHAIQNALCVRVCMRVGGFTMEGVLLTHSVLMWCVEVCAGRSVDLFVDGIGN